MNTLTIAEVGERAGHRLRFVLRRLDLRRQVSVLSAGDEPDALHRIYVINLDRRPDRWHRVRKELDRFTERHGARLSTLARRFSAVDARYMDASPDPTILVPSFTLADQLAVDPNPLLKIDDDSRAIKIEMTKQEVAVASSHIAVWRLIADGDVPSALVLEDDVFMPSGFARRLEETWTATMTSDVPNFDLLYLSFKEVGESLPKRSAEPAQRPRAGLWQASGYVLTREGARKLLSQLPVRGPVDLWLNQQFDNLSVYAAARCIIEQRIDEPSTNSYSVLPVLSQVGVITREKPLVPSTRQLRGPVIGVGEHSSGLTALAKALSMLGYTCISDLAQLPSDEHDSLLAGRGERLFNAYVNMGDLDIESLHAIAGSNPGARFIFTAPRGPDPDVQADRVLELPSEMADKWAALSNFLGVEYPSFPYPADLDIGQRTYMRQADDHESPTDFINLKCDKSPWIINPRRKRWAGLSIDEAPLPAVRVTGIDWSQGEVLDLDSWKLRDDTFPSNLALFSSSNFTEWSGQSALLTLRAEETSVRSFTSAAIASQRSWLYGTFGAMLKPSHVPGLITGVFLHRNGPRQEIDVEILGKDTTKMLVNVYFNPGPNGTKLEYGYRGTPTVIDLGFDAAADFHYYEIEWHPNMIRWKVDSQVVYQRVIWDPTPIPDSPLEFNVNLWHSRSTEFAGHLVASQLPASAELRAIEICSAGQEEGSHKSAGPTVAAEP